MSILVLTNSAEYREAFVAQYKATAVWSSTMDDDVGTPLDSQGYGVEHIAPESAREMRRECYDFIDANRDLLTRHAELSPDPAGQAGHDFWLTRNHHGSGFWDRGPEALYDDLSEAAKVYGESHLYVGSDGLLHVE
jgi:hypothetical protein